MIGEWDPDGSQAASRAENQERAKQRLMEEIARAAAKTIAAEVKTVLQPGAAKLENRPDWPQMVAEVRHIEGRKNQGTQVRVACDMAGMPTSTYYRVRKRLKELGQLP